MVARKRKVSLYRVAHERAICEWRQGVNDAKSQVVWQSRRGCGATR
jgi:hypothetical protein